MPRALLVAVLLSLFAVPGPLRSLSDAAAPPPSWVLTGGLGDFPADRYITGVGSAQVTGGDTAAAQAEADSRAIAQVAKQIEVVIDQQASSFERETASGAKETLSQRDIWEKTAAFVRLEVEGVRIEARHLDRDASRLYSLALLDRTAQGAMLAREIDGLVANAAALVAEAERSRTDVDRLYRAVAAYGLAVNKMLLALRKNQYLAIIDPRQVHHDLGDTLSGLQADLTAFVAGFTLTPAGGDNQQSAIGGSLAEPLQVQAAYQGRPVPSLTVQFALLGGRANIDAYARTDSQGVAATAVSNLGPTGRKINKIRAYLDIYPAAMDVREELAALIPPVFAQFTYFLPAVEDTRVVVLVKDFNLGRAQPDSFLGGRIARDLARAKLRVVKDLPADAAGAWPDDQNRAAVRERLQRLAAIADVAVVGKVEAAPMDGGVMEGLVFTRTRALVRIFDLAAGAELANVDLSIKSAGPSSQESGRRGLGRIAPRAAEQVMREVRRALFGE